MLVLTKYHAKNVNFQTSDDVLTLIIKYFLKEISIKAL